MKKYTLSAAGWENPRQAHEDLKKALSFPDHYGHNLDALHDCLTDMKDAEIIITDCSRACAAMPEKWPRFVQVFQDAEEENPRLSITLWDGAPLSALIGDTLRPLLEKYQVRRTRAQKDDFLQYAQQEAEKMGYPCAIDAHTGTEKSRNLVVGDVEKAQTVFTAHYDTCGESLMPNLVFPGNLLLTLLVQMPLVLTMVALGLWAMRLVNHWTGIPLLGLLAYLIIYGGYMASVLCGRANPHTANDNTSGTAALLAIMGALPEEDREKAAFIFFDNEEYGKIGSKAYAKSHPGQLDGKMLLNLDCIGDGDHFLIIPPKNADAAQVKKLADAFPEAHDKKPVLCRRSFNTSYNSDQKSFKNGIALAACRKNRLGYFVPRIHTRRDTICEESNLEYAVEGALRLVNNP